MARPTIIVEIDEDGNATIEVRGVKGRRCLALTKELEDALGTMISQTKTRDYYEQERTAVRQTQRQ